MRRISCLLCLLLFNLLLCEAQSPSVHFEHYNTDKGLSNGFVTTIFQDQKGFMWFGTRDGLNRFDGYQFEAMKHIPGDSTSLSNNWIEALYEDSLGNIWIGNRASLCVYYPQSKKFQTFNFGQTLMIQEIKGYQKNEMMLATDLGLLIFNTQTHQFRQVEKLWDRFCTYFHFDDQGIIWVGTSTGLYKYNPKTNQIKRYLLPAPKQIKLPTQFVNYIYESPKGKLWLSSWNSGLYQFDTETENFRVFYNDGKPNSLAGNIGMNILMDDSGRVWMANFEGGVAVLDTSSSSVTSYPCTQGKENGISGIECRSLFRDREGIYWMGTDNGISKLDFSSQTFNTYILPVHRINEINATEILCIENISENKLILGTYYGLIHFDMNTLKLELLNKKYGLSDIDGVFTLFKLPNQDLIVGLKGSLILIKPNGLFKKITMPNFHSSPYGFLAEKDGTFWMATWGNGLIHYSPLTGESENYILPEDLRTSKYFDIVTCIEHLDSTHLILGIHHQGTYTFNKRNKTFERKLLFSDSTNTTDNLKIEALYRDSKNIFWAATEFGGVWKFDHTFKVIKQFTESTGLPSLRCEKILEDKNGNIWISTSSGIVKIKDGEIVDRVFGISEGLLNPGQLGPFIKTMSGNFLLEDNGVLQSFNPNILLPLHRLPDTYITKISVAERPLEMNDHSHAEFAYYDNSISFEFVGISFSGVEKNMYSYRLVGIDTNWSAPGKNRSISYAGLKGGTYRFEVRSSNKDGLWDLSPAVFSFKIKPPFWNTWWFYVMLSLLLAGLIFTWVQIRIRRIKAEFTMRNKIARDLHDEVGSTLSSINMLAQFAKGKQSDSMNESATILEKIGERSQKMLESMSDIVWNINKQNDSLERILIRMKEFAYEVVESKNMACHFTYPESTLGISLGLEIRNDFYLIFKEAVNNAGKYSGGKTLEINVRKEGAKLILIVKDDGKGFDTKRSSSGNGLRNMNERARKINATLTIISELGKGTELKLEVPIPRIGYFI